MATREGGEGAWALMAAAWPLLQDGSAEALRELAARNDESADLARSLLGDLGLETPALERAA
jgi:hypothetical protein